MKTYMSDDKLIERAHLLERMRDAMEHARIHGVEPSPYFLDKCNSEAGFGNDVELEDTTQPVAHRGLWSILLGRK